MGSTSKSVGAAGAGLRLAHQRHLPHVSGNAVAGSTTTSPGSVASSPPPPSASVYQPGSGAFGAQPNAEYFSYDSPSSSPFPQTRRPPRANESGNSEYFSPKFFQPNNRVGDGYGNGSDRKNEQNNPPYGSPSWPPPLGGDNTPSSPYYPYSPGGFNNGAGGGLDTPTPSSPLFSLNPHHQHLHPFHPSSSASPSSLAQKALKGSSSSSSTGKVGKKKSKKSKHKRDQYRSSKQRLADDFDATDLITNLGPDALRRYRQVYNLNNKDVVPTNYQPSFGLVSKKRKKATAGSSGEDAYGSGYGLTEDMEWGQLDVQDEEAKREGLAAAAAAHFASRTVRETESITNFLYAVRNRGKLLKLPPPPHL